MDNHHLSSNTNNNNNSLPHSINNIDQRLNQLNVNENQSQSSRSLPTNYGDISMYQNNSAHSVASSRLNPSAQEFVPRQNPIPPNYRNNTNHMMPNHHTILTNNHSFSNGTNNVINESENDMEDYMSLSYLKDFINLISNKPGMYDNGISELTLILNSYLDEDDCVLELIVNQIVDQSIIDANFRYNGVRLCDHFMNNLRETSSGQSFKQLLFKRSQRECSRKVSNIDSANTLNHLRGLALFTAELYERNLASELADHLPNLLLNILSSNVKRDENIKSVCQVLKICGQKLHVHLESKEKGDFKNIVAKLRETLQREISKVTEDMVKKVLILIENNWIQPQSASNSNIVNPYLNYNNNIHFDSNNQYCQNLYDFGNCGDENNAEVCQDFEKFLKSTQKN